MRTENGLDRCLEELEIELAELPKDIRLSSPSRARIRSQIMAHAYAKPRRWWQPLVEPFTAAWAPAHLAPALVRPLAVVLSVVTSASVVGSGTVYAAMDSLPGDGLYPVKTVYEQTRLALAATEEERAETYVWIASVRVGDLARAADNGRLDAVPKVAESYGANIAQALSLAASSKEQEKLQQQADAVQTSMAELYRKSPEPVKEMVAIALSVAVTTNGTSDALRTPSTPVNGPVQETAAVRPSAFVEEPVDPQGVSAQPQGRSTVPTNKGQTVPEPTPVKDGPISNPPVPVSSEPLPVKNDVGPATAPLPTKDGASSLPVETDKPEAPAGTLLPVDGKAEPTATPTPVDATVPTKESGPISSTPVPSQKDPIVIQSVVTPLAEKR